MGCASSTPQGASDFHTDYVLSKKLGEGSFASVFRCKERKTNDSKTLAVKVIDVSTSASIRKEARKEAQLWQRIADGHNVVHLANFFEDKKFCYLVMEQCRCTVLQAFLEQDDTGEDELSHCFRGMLDGLQFIHSRDIVHRDVKPDNFLLQTGTTFSKDSVVKLCDFGLAAALPRQKPTSKGIVAMMQQSALTNVCGTAPYMAPEMLTPSKGGYDTAVDMWAMGVSGYLMLFGEFPYRPAQSGSKEMMETIRAGKQEPSYKARAGFPQPSTSACNFVRDLLHRSPQFRPDAQFAKKNVFISKITRPEAVQVQVEDVPMPGYVRSDARKQSFHQTLMVAQDVAHKVEQYKVQDGDVVRFPSAEVKKAFEAALMDMQREHGVSLRNNTRTMSGPSQSLKKLSFSDLKEEVPNSAVPMARMDSLRSQKRLNTHSGSFLHLVVDKEKVESDDEGKSTTASDISRDETSRDAALLKEPDAWKCGSDSPKKIPTKPQSL